MNSQRTSRNCVPPMHEYRSSAAVKGRQAEIGKGESKACFPSAVLERETKMA